MSWRNLAVGIFGYERRIAMSSAIYDALHNMRLRRRGKRIFVVRQREGWRSNYNEHFLRWVGDRAPAAARLFEVGRVSGREPDWDRCGLFLPWLLDPLKERDPALFERARQLEAECEKRGVPVVNPVASLSNSIKSTAAQRLAAAGIRCARVVMLGRDDVLSQPPPGLTYPFFVREDRLHSGALRLVSGPGDLKTVDLGSYRHPIGVEYIDVKSRDGYYRKYRYVVAGDRGAPRHLVISTNWVVRAAQRKQAQALVDEEITYTNSTDPNHSLLITAARALDFDVVTFDYSYDRNGEVVLWEPNPFPLLWANFNRAGQFGYQEAVMDRLYGTLLAYYLERAGIDV